MKFFDLEGNVVSKQIQKYKWDRRRKCASKGQRKLGEALLGMFPNIVIYTEVPCFGTKMRLDFFLPELRLCVEWDGEQHKEFNPFFHGTKKRFLAQKNRDVKKEEWCEVNGFRIIRVNDDNFDALESLIRNAK